MKTNLDIEKSEKHEETLVGRGQWATKTEFVLSCMGYAIGIGNIWRFPYLCYNNGGGAFLIPYLLMLVFCGIPLYFMEVSLGQFASTGCLTLFKMSPILKGTGYAMIFINFIVMIYFNVVVSYPILYMFKSFSFPELPWSSCSNAWNSQTCYELTGNMSSDVYSVKLQSDDYRPRTSADEYFNKVILEKSNNIEDIGEIAWPLFCCNLLSWVIMYFCIQRGVKSIGKVVYFTVLFPFVLLIILFVRGVTLPGAWEGIKFYVIPDWSKLLNIRVWVDAAMQIFYSLGPGWGGIISVSSFNKFHNKTKFDSILIPIANCSTSIFAGFVVFSVLGFMSHKTGISVADVASSGFSLAFVTYPEAISFLPWPQLWAILFFFMLFLLGVDTGFVTIEAVVNAVFDEFPKSRRNQKLVYFLVIFAMFVGSIPFVTKGGIYLVQIFDWYAASVAVIFICLVEIVMVGWIYGAKNFIRDIEFMTGNKIGRWWYLCWKYITPVLLIIIFLITSIFAKLSATEFPFPNWVKNFGGVLSLTPISFIVLYFAYSMWMPKGNIKEKLKLGFTPRGWGPADIMDRERWEEYIKIELK